MGLWLYLVLESCDVCRPNHLTMAGFQFSLKSKVSKPGAKKSGVLLAKGKSKAAIANVLGPQDDDEPKKASIDAFDATKGALSGNSAIQTELVIVPGALRTGLLKSTKGESNTTDKIQKSEKLEASASASTDPTDAEDIESRARESLKKGEKGETQASQLSLPKISGKIDENQEQDYEDIPVDQFGAALLRGMGWDGKMRGAETDVTHRQKGVVLGIGAHLVGVELETEIIKGAKLSVPLVRRSERE